MATSAPAMTEPEGSVTVPESVAPVTCALAVDEMDRKNTKVRNAANPTADFLKRHPLRIINNPLYMNRHAKTPTVRQLNFYENQPSLLVANEYLRVKLAGSMLSG